MINEYDKIVFENNFHIARIKELEAENARLRRTIGEHVAARVEKQARIDELEDQQVLDTEAIERIRTKAMELDDCVEATRDVVADQLKRIAELEQAKHKLFARIVAGLAREEKLREALDEIGNLNKAAKLSPVITQIIGQAFAIPQDDTALREAKEEYLNNSPEIELLNRIGRFLSGVMGGIHEVIKQAKREALLGAADAMVRVEEIAAEGMLRRMAEEMK